MMFYMPNKAQREFSRNLLDWSLGGPKSGGWTRVGDRIPVPDIVLVGYRFGNINVDDGLAKNSSEVERWHLQFLAGNEKMYLDEYLTTRYDFHQARARADSFVRLLNDIRNHGIKKPVWVVDVEKFGLGMRYFRFDGCHRLCCAKWLQISNVPAIIFKSALR